MIYSLIILSKKKDRTQFFYVNLKQEITVFLTYWSLFFLTNFFPIFLLLDLTKLQYVLLLLFLCLISKVGKPLHI